MSTSRDFRSVTIWPRHRISASQGKHILITGGTGGIGSAFAKAFLDHGEHVIVSDLAEPKDGIDPRIHYEQLDVRDDAAVDR